MRDVAERTSVHERRSALQRLHEIRPDGVREEQRHRARSLELTGAYRAARLPPRRAHDDARETILEVFIARRERHDRHDLARGDDDELLLARDTVAFAQPDDDLAQCAVVHVDRAMPGDLFGVDTQLIA